MNRTPGHVNTIVSKLQRKNGDTNASNTQQPTGNRCRFLEAQRLLVWPQSALVLFILWQIFDLQHENLTATGHNDDRKRGCLAEYICCNVDRLVEKPSCLTFEEVNSGRLECRKTHHNSAFTIRFPDQRASLPVCAMTAWAALFEQGKCTPGARVSYPKLFLLFAWNYSSYQGLPLVSIAWKAHE